MSDVLIFFAEMAVYVTVALAGWRVHPALGVAAPLLMALWWGSLHSPKAAVTLARPADVLLRVLWFLIGVGCLVWLARR